METKTLRVALYARVSTKQHGQNPETQLIPLRELVKQRQFRLIDEYVDVGISGVKEKRPELDRLMTDARARRLDAVIVWRFDRFGRSLIHLAKACEEFRSLGIQFISLTENIDTTTAMGTCVFQIMGALAQMERAMIQERVKAGVQRARREGRRLGRPRKIVDQDYVLRRFEEGDSQVKIARIVGVSRGTIQTLLIHAKKARENGAKNSVAQAEVTR